MRNFTSAVFISILIVTAVSDQQLYSQSVNFESSNLPIIVINTHGTVIPDEPKIDATMGIIDNGFGNRNVLTYPYNSFSGRIGIEVRGNSSQNFPKQQYAFEIRDVNGNDIDAPLLGLPAESDWVLSAGYSDKSLIRNALAYYLSNAAGKYASRFRFCELILNDEYMGVYVLFEKINRNKNRVNISKMTSDDVAGDNVTGGYIIKRDKKNGNDDGWNSPFALNSKEMSYIYVYPKAENIVTEQKAYIRRYVTDFENSINDSNFTDPVNGYQKFFDLNSAVDYFLINELSKNIDGFRYSMYLYKDRESKGGKLKVGPVWDFDIAFGNVDFYDGSVSQGWNLEHIDADFPFWWKRLLKDSALFTKASERWGALRSKEFSIGTINHFIDSLALYLDEAQTRNFQRWPILGSYVWPNSFIGKTYASEIQYLKGWVSDRFHWMDGTLLEERIHAENSTIAMKMDVESFSVIQGQSNAMIAWTTNSETNATTFEIQRYNPYEQESGIRWTTIGSVEAKKTNKPQEYRFTDTLAQSESYLYRLKANGVFGQFFYVMVGKTSTGINDLISENNPSQFLLEQNYPNPFNPTTVISYQLPVSGHVTLRVFDMLGREVVTLIDGEKDAGAYSATFNAQSLSTGMYIYELRASTFVSVKKMILMK